MGGSGVPVWHAGVGFFGGMQEVELRASFSRTVGWGGQWDMTPFLALSALSQGPGAGHWGLPVVSSHC